MKFLNDLIASRGRVVPMVVHDSEVGAFYRETERLSRELMTTTAVIKDALLYLRKHEPTRGDRRRAQHDAIVSRLEGHLSRIRE